MNKQVLPQITSCFSLPKYLPGFCHLQQITGTGNVFLAPHRELFRHKDWSFSDICSLENVLYYYGDSLQAIACRIIHLSNANP